MYTNKIEIKSTGQFLPSQIVKSDDIFIDMKSESRYDIPTTWMSETMGIVERRMVAPGTKPSELAIPAARQAIENADINPELIDMVIFCGIERDRPEPATAHTIQHELGLRAKYAFDVANACYGFIEGMEIAQKFMETGVVKYALIVTGEITTKVLMGALENLKKGVDIKTARNLIGLLSVGDAGGAVLLGLSEDQSGFDLITTDSESRHAQKCYYKFKKNGEFTGQMQMGYMSALFIDKHDKLINNTLQKLKWPEFDWMLSHQIGQRPFDRISDLNGVGKEKMVKTFHKLGNITTATFPVNFHKLLKNDTLSKGDRIGGCFGGSGVVYGQFGYLF